MRRWTQVADVSGKIRLPKCVLEVEFGSVSFQLGVAKTPSSEIRGQRHENRGGIMANAALKTTIGVITTFRRRS